MIRIRSELRIRIPGCFLQLVPPDCLVRKADGSAKMLVILIATATSILYSETTLADLEPKSMLLPIGTEADVTPNWNTKTPFIVLENIAT